MEYVASKQHGRGPFLGRGSPKVPYFLAMRDWAGEAFDADYDATALQPISLQQHLGHVHRLCAMHVLAEEKRDRERERERDSELRAPQGINWPLVESQRPKLPPPRQ